MTSVIGDRSTTMAGCCHDDAPEGTCIPTEQARMLRVVLAVNAVMFAVEFTAGWLADSTALMGDSLDMLGDALVYTFSLYVVARSLRWKAGSALLKGGIMAAFGLVVLVDAALVLRHGAAPHSLTMAAVGALALAANAACLALLTRRRGDDVNMRSAWLCSRNDLVANTGVLAAAAAVAATGSPWPDVIVGVAIAALFLRSSFSVFGDARATLRRLGEAEAGAR